MKKLIERINRLAGKEIAEEDDGMIFIAVGDWGGHWPVDEAEAIIDLMSLAYRHGRRRHRDLILKGLRDSNLWRLFEAEYKREQAEEKAHQSE